MCSRHSLRTFKSKKTRFNIVYPLFLSTYYVREVLSLIVWLHNSLIYIHPWATAVHKHVNYRYNAQSNLIIYNSMGLQKNSRKPRVRDIEVGNESGFSREIKMTSYRIFISLILTLTFPWNWSRYQSSCVHVQVFITQPALVE